MKTTIKLMEFEGVKDFSEDITAMIDDRWEFHGFPFADGGLIYQAMIKYDRTDWDDQLDYLKESHGVMRDLIRQAGDVCWQHLAQHVKPDYASMLRDRIQTIMDSELQKRLAPLAKPLSEL